MREVEWLKGRSLEGVGDPGDHGQWLFRFEGDRLLNVECPWRLVDRGAMVLGRCDHRQKFGLPEPVDAVATLSRLVGGRRVERMLVSEHGDLRLEFTGGVRLETFTESAGYESWTLRTPDAPLIVARGGDGAME